MSLSVYAVRLGLRRGWTEFRQSVTSPGDIAYYLFLGGVFLGVLFFMRNKTVDGTELSLATLSMPSMIGGLLAFQALGGAAFALAAEREDGTLLRARTVPHGLIGYISGRVLGIALSTLLTLLIILIPSVFLFDDLVTDDLGKWLNLIWVLGLGLLATLPIGLIVGAMVKNPRGANTWGIFPTMGLLAISGIFYPITSLVGWLQGVSQIFPVYWVGLGTRAALLPESAVAVELGDSWRRPMTAVVLLVWAVVALLIAPKILSLTARGETGSKVEARQQEALKRVG
ncbi:MULTISPECIES: ABC transporter permease [Streptomyces]|uniref:ABC transporter n=1 Tax=Streptomyces tsukubensis (strain DSM 42081 / NBRC 108919 / NRRL 18488 / 9993) TaxID=1114943 RepID=A0A7G3UBG8_STRT9|nr:ABC transporter permease [Streptomyces tsukubensis]AZK96254.1 ABC transporter [Streptomyces tsukubensis]MYS67369.1 ABC transporter permease [Streptomyces sp. SID5473]QKM67737.1 ABC transporter [Streptomyces tsukubensis NRRL18488]TAI44132.1 ABC transporter permease [Streptomyces tsukubensis]